MRSSSITTSAMFHIAVIIIATISLPWLKKDYEVPKSISVEMVDIAELTQTTKVKPVSVPKQEKPKEEPPVVKPPPVKQNTSAEPVAPVKEDKKEEKPDVKKEDVVLVDKNAPPEKKKTPKEEKKKEVTKEEPKKNFSSLLKSLEDTKDTPVVKADTPDLKLDEDSTPTEGHDAPLGVKMTMSEEDALRRQLEGCWSPPMGAKDAETLKVDIFMVINADRTLQQARVVDTARYNSDSFFRAAADSAMRAVQNDKCSPFQLPPDKYDTWKSTTVTFDPSQMF